MNLDKAFSLKTVLVATDFSRSASAALRYAQTIARARNAALVLVHVIDPVGYAFPVGAPASISRDEVARVEVAQIEQTVRQQGIQVHSEIETGVICERILEAVRDHSASLLVLGTEAKTRAGRAALGVLARQLLVHCPCPILTVPPETKARLSVAGLWGSVLVAMDFSPSSLAAITCAQGIVERQLIVVHTVCCGKEANCSICLGRLRLLAPFNESHTAPIEHFVPSGNPVATTEEFAKRFRADLIVLGAPSIELSAGEMESSTIMQIISGVHCPVLVVPADAAIEAKHTMEAAVAN